MKFNQGWVGIADGAKADVIVEAKTPCTVADLLIGGSIVLLGLGYMTWSSFKYGASRHEIAEYEALSNIGCAVKRVPLED